MKNPTLAFIAGMTLLSAIVTESTPHIQSAAVGPTQLAATDLPIPQPPRLLV